MANSYSQAGPDRTGKKKRTQTATVGSDTVHAGYDIQTSDATGNRSRVLNANPTTTDYGIVSREVSSKAGYGRTERTFVATGLTGNKTAATLISMTPYTDYVAGGATTTFTVTSGKTFVVQYMTMTNLVAVATTIFWARFELRVNTGGAVVATSPIAATLSVPPNMSTAAAIGGQSKSLSLGEGVAIPSGAGFGMTQIDSGGTAIRLNMDVALYGYEI